MKWGKCRFGSLKIDGKKHVNDVILDQGVVFILNCFLPLLPSRGMIDDFLHYY